MVRDDALPQGAHGDHVARGTVQHIPGRGTDLEDFSGVPVQGNNRRLPNHQPLPVGVNQNIGCTQVNAQVIGKKLHFIHPLGYFF